MTTTRLPHRPLPKCHFCEGNLVESMNGTYLEITCTDCGRCIASRYTPNLATKVVVKLTAGKRLIIPPEIVAEITDQDPDVEYFEVMAVGREITLRPVTITLTSPDAAPQRRRAPLRR